MTTLTNSSSPKSWYLGFLILLSGLGGLVAGIDYGIISVALLYLDKTISMTPAEQGFMVSIYVFGGVIASLVAGPLADLVGRKKMLLIAGIMFVASILLIYVAQGYMSLLVGRVLMGLSGGFVCVVVPLYMAECLPSDFRGRGTSAFQFLMTVGFFLSTIIGNYFAGIHKAAVAAAKGNPELIFAADNAAWRNIFLTALAPGLLLIIVAILAKESPRWLFRRRRGDEAAAVLRLTRTPEQAELELKEMGERANEGVTKESGSTPAHADSLFQRKYVVPFVIACIVLACTQATGINSIMSYGAKILQGSGLSEKDAAANLQIVTGINVLVTLVGALLVDKLGRKILLTVGTGGIIACLFATGVIFNNFESKRVDVLAQIQKGLNPDGIHLEVPIDTATLGSIEGNAPGQLSVAYKFEKDSKPTVVAAFSNAEKSEDRVLKIAPPAEQKWEVIDGKKVEVKRVKDSGKLQILNASYGPIADASTGKWVTILLCAFIGFFAIGPGVCVWLALTELMPTRIRSTGMSIAMVLNTGVQFLSALFFPIVVGSSGFHMMFFIWGSCTVLYFITAAFFMPETKGKTLEEIEDYFAGKKS